MSKYLRDYETYDEIERQLNNTIVLYDGQPVHITGIESLAGKFKLYLIKPDDKVIQSIWQDEKDRYDLSPFPPMYVYIVDYGAMWLNRVVKRMWKQGACSQNTATFLEPTGQNQGFSGKNLLNLIEQGLNKPIENKLTAKFLADIKTTADRLGFNRMSNILNQNLVASYSTKDGYLLHYRSRTIGSLTVDGEHVVYLSNNPSGSLNPWLREALQKAGI